MSEPTTEYQGAEVARRLAGDPIYCCTCKHWFSTVASRLIGECEVDKHLKSYLHVCRVPDITGESTKAYRYVGPGYKPVPKERVEIGKH